MSRLSAPLAFLALTVPGVAAAQDMLPSSTNPAERVVHRRDRSVED